MRKWNHAFLHLLAIAAAIPVQANEPKAERVVYESKGYLVAASQIAVSPKVAGQVVELLIEEGKHVKKGDVLARLDPQEFKAALALAHAKSKLAEAELAKAKEGTSRADRAIGEAKVEVARAALLIAEHKLDCTTIRAPIDGIIMTKRADVGSRIDPNSAQLAPSLCDMADQRLMEIEVWIPERDLEKIVKGQACVIKVDAFPNATYRGRVVRMNAIADRARGALAVRVRLDRPAANDQLRPEFSAVVQFLAKEKVGKE
jgi:multidrug resistance efflux pump